MLVSAIITNIFSVNRLLANSYINQYATLSYIFLFGNVSLKTHCHFYCTYCMLQYVGRWGYYYYSVCPSEKAI